MNQINNFFYRIQLIVLYLLIFSLYSSVSIAQTESETAQSNILFNWAEKQYASFFSPAHSTTQSIMGYLARYYANTETWLATMDKHLYVYGPPFNDIEPVGLSIKPIGQISDYWSLVQASLPLVINEIVAKDAAGGADWFEVYVTGKEAVHLSDYSVIDDDPERTPVALPAITLAPGQFLVIWATDEPVEAGKYLVPFKLGAHDSLSLFKGEELIDYLAWNESDAPSGSSYGLLPKHLSEAQTLKPTPGANNESNATVHNDEVIKNETSPQQAIELFDMNKVVDVNIDIKTEDWEAILADPMAEEYKPSTITFNGVKLENVAFRTKGNSSLMSVAKDKNSKRYSFKVDIDRYVPEQTLSGIRKLNFNNNWSDPSYMRDVLSYDLMRFLGLPTPRIAYVNLSINHQLHGLYTVVEQVDALFLQKNFTHAEGDLYKPDGKGSDLVWISNNFKDYSGLELQTNEDSSDHSAFMTMMEVLNHGTDYESVLNVDEILRYFAVSTALSNLDSYQGPMKHNYYLYEENGVFSIIPWDFNLSFGSFDMGCSEEETIGLMIDEPTVSALSERPLIGKLLQNPNYRATYHHYFEELINGPLNPDTLAQSINKIATLIRNFVYADPSAFYTPEEFEASLTEGLKKSTTLTEEANTVSEMPAPGMAQAPGGAGGMGSRFGLQSFVTRRVANLRGQLEGTIPSSGDGSGSCKTGGMFPGRTPPEGGLQPPDGFPGQAPQDVN